MCLFLGALIFIFKSALFRYNLYTVKCSHVKCCTVVDGQSLPPQDVDQLTWLCSNCKLCTSIQLVLALLQGSPYTLQPSGASCGCSRQKDKLSIRVLPAHTGALSCSSTVGLTLWAQLGGKREKPPPELQGILNPVLPRLRLLQKLLPLFTFF